MPGAVLPDRIVNGVFWEKVFKDCAIAIAHGEVKRNTPAPSCSTMSTSVELLDCFVSGVLTVVAWTTKLVEGFASGTGAVSSAADPKFATAAEALIGE